jgi:hypothetical protein
MQHPPVVKQQPMILGMMQRAFDKNTKAGLR